MHGSRVAGMCGIETSVTPRSVCLVLRGRREAKRNIFGGGIPETFDPRISLTPVNAAHHDLIASPPQVE